MARVGVRSKMNVRVAVVGRASGVRAELEERVHVQVRVIVAGRPKPKP